MFPEAHFSPQPQIKANHKKAPGLGRLEICRIFVIVFTRTIVKTEFCTI